MEVLTEERAVLGESPLWHRSQELFYWVDIAAGLVFSYDPNSGRTVQLHSGLMVAALSEVDDGGVVLVTRRGLFTLREDRLAVVAPLELSKKVRTTYGKCDRRGGVWFGTMDLEATRPIAELFVYDGRELRRVRDQVILSNGLGWSPTGDTFYHVDTTRRLIHRHDYDIETGAASRREVLVDLSGALEAPDGLAVDVDGNLWVAMWDDWRVSLFNDNGENGHRESLPVQRPTSAAIGGAGLNELYVTTATEDLEAQVEEQTHAGKVLRLDPGISGLPIGVFPQGRKQPRRVADDLVETTLGFRRPRVLFVRRERDFMPAVVGVFPDRQETESAIDELVGLGIDQDSIGVVWRERSVPRQEVVEVIVYVDHFEEPAVEARKGAIGGAVGGGAAGIGGVLLASAGGVVLATPIGALLAVGTVAAAALAGAAGAVGGSITGGLIGALLGATDHDATKVKSTETSYRDAIQRDGFVLTIETTEDRLEQTSDALVEVGAKDISVLREQGDRPRTVTLRNEE
jgi:sugar lactone lactonase YvrE